MKKINYIPVKILKLDSNVPYNICKNIIYYFLVQKNDFHLNLQISNLSHGVKINLSKCLTSLFIINYSPLCSIFKSSVEKIVKKWAMTGIRDTKKITVISFFLPVISNSNFRRRNTQKMLGVSKIFYFTIPKPIW